MDEASTSYFPCLVCIFSFYSDICNFQWNLIFFIGLENVSYLNHYYFLCILLLPSSLFILPSLF